jgi:hypothetical protein
VAGIGQSFARAREVVLVGGDRAEGMLMACPWGLNGLGAEDGFDNAGAGAMRTNHAGKPGVGVGSVGVVRYVVLRNASVED